MLALPNAALIAAGLAQSALDASLNQALSDCSASAYSGFSQNNRSVLREIILILQLIMARSQIGSNRFAESLPPSRCGRNQLAAFAIRESRQLSYRQSYQSHRERVFADFL